MSEGLKELLVFWGIATVCLFGVGFFVMAVLKMGSRADERMKRMIDEKEAK